MNWTDPLPPVEGASRYDHVSCDTPLGRCLIEWKSWKTRPEYDVGINGEYIGNETTLDSAKALAVKWLTERHAELTDFLWPIR